MPINKHTSPCVHVIKDVGPNKRTVYSCEFDGIRRTIATQTLKDTGNKACSPDSAIDSPGLHSFLFSPLFILFCEDSFSFGFTFVFVL